MPRAVRNNARLRERELNSDRGRLEVVSAPGVDDAAGRHLHGSLQKTP